MVVDHIVFVRKLRIFRVCQLTLSLINQSWVELLSILEHATDLQLILGFGLLFDGVRAAGRKLVGFFAAHQLHFFLDDLIRVARLHSQVNRCCRRLLLTLPFRMHRRIHLNLHALPCIYILVGVIVG